MKARALQKRLNTKRTVHFSGDKVCIASAYIHDLISYNVNTKAVRNALDSTDPELRGLTDTLKTMAESGEILQYVDGEDELSERLPVYSCDDDGNIVESITDKYGWPNVTSDGIQMHDNTHFETREEAIQSGIENFEAGVKCVTDMVRQAEEHLVERRKLLDRYELGLQKLRRPTGPPDIN